MGKKTKSVFNGALKNLTEQDKDNALRQLIKTLDTVNNRLRRTESPKSNFLSNIRNEMNNPLTVIMGLSQQIMEGPFEKKTVIRQKAETIFAEAFNLDFQLRNIFAAAELEAGEHTLSVCTVDVDELVKDTVHSFRRKAKQKAVKILHSCGSLSQPGDTPLFRTDPEKLKIILSNLISNAIEFSHKGGKIELTVQIKGSDLNISIRDYGIGIERENEKIIFERFSQLDTGTKRKHHGHGLGLSVIKDLTEMLGGTISLTSAEGKGTVFTVLLPESDKGTEGDVLSVDGNVYFF